MGARGRVPSRARRPARVGASSRALARRRSAAPYAVVAAVGRDASFRTTTDRARRGGAESKFDPLVSSAHARAAWRSAPVGPRASGVRWRVATRPAGACTACLRCTLGAARMGERAGGAHGRVALRSGGLFMCPCWWGKVHLHIPWSGLPSCRRSPSPARGPPLQVQSLAMPCVVLAEPNWIQSCIQGRRVAGKRIQKLHRPPGSYLICT